MEVEKHAVLQSSNHGQVHTKLEILPHDRLLEEPKHGNVPNHLLETKIYSTIQRNKTIKAIPAMLHFGGYEIGKHHQQNLVETHERLQVVESGAKQSARGTLVSRAASAREKINKLSNISSAITNVHILPPQTKNFQIKYTKKSHLVPGMSFIVTVDFCPNELRYYYDSIRIHCKEDETLLVPIHAYPVANVVDFPTHLTINDVPLGQSKDIIIPLRCTCPIDFEFRLNFLQLHHAFKIQPTSGIIPANEQIDIVITYTPSDRATAQIKVQLIISEFNSKPYICTVNGIYSPGLEFRPQAEYKEIKDTITKKLLDPQSISPIHISRKKRHQKNALDHTSGKLKYSKTSVIQNSSNQQPQATGKNVPENKQDIKFPADLSSPHAVALILNQKPGKLRIKDLREGASQGRQAKEAMFNQKVNNNVMLEQANQLQWQSHLGRDAISPKTKQLILESRQQANEEYKMNLYVHVPEKECQRQETKISLTRVLRSVGQFPSCTPEFDPYSNNPWEIRNRALKRFQLAARKVIIQCRVNHRLILLRKLISSLKNQRESSINFNESSTVNFDYSDQENEKYCESFSIEKLQPFTFPYYISPDWSDELAPDALGSVPVKPLEVTINRVVPYFNLKAFRHYKLMDYEPYSSQYASSSYVPLTLARPLRTGAEDEFILLSTHGEKPETDTHLDEDHMIKDSEVEKLHGRTLTIVPPEGLLKQPDYHPLYVFNLAPDLYAFKTPLSFAETDLEFHLCPLPRYIIDRKEGSNFGSTQKKFLDREDIIKGLMNWKKFPSAALKFLSTTDFLTNTWVPRWNDPFSLDMLPVEVPLQLDYQSEENWENMESPEELVLTPEMLEAAFTMIQDSLSDHPTFETAQEDEKTIMAKSSQTLPPVQPTTREVREQQLEISLQAQNNQLGSSCQMWMEHLKHLSINKLLLLN